jgi:hypothetical protein
MKLWITFLIALFVGMVLVFMLSSFVGCVPEERSCQPPIFIQGEKVDLVLGGEAQVISAHRGVEGPWYIIRVKTLNGLEKVNISEFELYLPLVDVDHSNVLEIR